jgi:hypothetical protein
MLPQGYPNYKTAHRRFQAWCRNEVLRRVLTDVANELRDKGVLDEEESFIDATFAMAKGGGAESDQAWKRHENHGDRGSPWRTPVGEHARGKPASSTFHRLHRIIRNALDVVFDWLKMNIAKW